MRIERTTDSQLIRSVITHQAIYPYISDDGSTSPEDYEPVIDDSLYWLAVLDGQQTAGLFLVHPWNCATVEIHTCVLPAWRGAKARVAAALVLTWIFTNTAFQKVVTHVPEPNRLAKKLAIDAGFSIEGINRKSFLQQGQLLNQTLLGITKEEWSSCQQPQL